MIRIGALTIEIWMVAVSVIFFSVLAGVIFEIIFSKWLRRIARKFGWKWGEAIFRSSKWLLFLWFLLAGVYFASVIFPLEPKLATYLHKFILILLILSATLGLTRLSVEFMRIYTKNLESALPSASILANLTYILVFSIGLLVFLQTLGISITPILTALGVGGLAVALALRDTLSNLFAGLQIILNKQVIPGDYIKLDSGEEGFVTDISWRNTTIRQLANNLVIIPNSKLASSIITNFHRPEPELSVLIKVGVSYGSDLEKVEQVTLETAKQVMSQVQAGADGFEPTVRFHSFGESSIDFTVILWAKEFSEQFILRHEFIKRLHQRFSEEGIEIPFPIRTIYMKGESKR